MLVVKRTIDIVIAAIALLLLAPVLVAFALVILVADGRPILFRQRRVGRFGRLFTIYKFRTMVPDAHQRLDEIAHTNERHGPLFKASDDPRVTTIGKFLRRSSIDELPQLVNVLNGTMSLVGPRPALPEEREQFPLELLERERLPQGLSGLWQLQGRHSSDFGVYRELDLEYVRTWSLRRDLSILVRTPFVVGAQALRRPAQPTTTPEGVDPHLAVTRAPARIAVAAPPEPANRSAAHTRAHDAIPVMTMSATAAGD